eukprot:1068826-Amphidinium_carterae.1
MTVEAPAATMVTCMDELRCSLPCFVSCPIKRQSRQRNYLCISCFNSESTLRSGDTKRSACCTLPVADFLLLLNRELAEGKSLAKASHIGQHVHGLSVHW